MTSNSLWVTNWVRLAVICAAILISHQLVNAQTTVFSTDFEYTTEPSVGLDAANLNSADTQIGTFSGTIPAGSGAINPGTNLIGFINHPDATFGRAMLLDQAIDESTSSYFANFTQGVEVDGATFGFHVGTRRTNNNQDKDYDIIGRDQNNNELFRLTVNTDNGEERLGVVHTGGTTVYDLIGTFGGTGNDNDLDLLNIAQPGDNIGVIALSLTDTGYILDFNEADGTDVYTTDEIPFNGTPDSLFSHVEFTFSGGSTAVSSGYLLDEIVAQGNLPAAEVVPEPHSVAIWLLLGMAFAGYGVWRRYPRS